jgi:hypothetical protein
MRQEGHYRDIASAQLYGDDSSADVDAPSHMKRVQAGGAVPGHAAGGGDDKNERLVDSESV